MLQKSTFNLLGSCNFKWLRVAETAHPTTIARLIGRSVFGGMVCINFLRGEISTAHLSKLVCAIRQDNFVIALWRGRCESPPQGARLPEDPLCSLFNRLAAAKHRPDLVCRSTPPPRSPHTALRPTHP